MRCVRGVLGVCDGMWSNKTIITKYSQKVVELRVHMASFHLTGRCVRGVLGVVQEVSQIVGNKECPLMDMVAVI